ncbi:glutaredoxin family protein [Solirubrobacter soli]|uniref:glutaredoxin family protein n=1 Tax=Solirubrobacter soli TaxID=363832 RepID=UPI000403071F|nr:glutaredoxin family protein [Solirubrobacter soli]
MTTVTLYSRPGCHLCEEARAVLDRLRANTPFDVEEIDIEGDDVLHARYLTRIPVVAIDGEELFDYTIDEEALIRRILYREGR